MILYREVVIDNWDSSMTEYVRIKIFRDEGRKWADVQLPFAPDAWEIKDLRARTIRPDGSIVDFKGQVFDELVVKARGFKIRMKRFSLQDVQPGSVVEYIYRRQYRASVSTPDEWTVQSDLYTRLGVFTFRPYLGFSAVLWREHGLPPGLAPQKQKDGSFRLEIHNLPGVENEDLMPPERLVRARVGFFYRHTLVPGNPTAAEYWKQLGKDWNKVFEQFMSKKHTLEEVAAQTIRPGDPPEIKLRGLYARAQQIKNLDYEAEQSARPLNHENLQPNETVEDVINHGYGTSRQINDVFIGLSRAAGFESSLVYYASRDDDFFAPNLQDPGQLNADMVAVHLGSQDLYLDPGDPYYPFGLLPWFGSEVQGMRLTPEGGVIMTTAAPLSADAILSRHSDLQLAADGLVSGKLQIDFSGQRACVIREEDREKTESDRQKDLHDDIKSWLPDNSTIDIAAVTGWGNNSVPLHVEGTLQIPGFATVATNRILFPVTIFREPQAHVFHSGTRMNPIYFPYPYQNQDEISFSLPPGFTVEALPPMQKTPKSLVEFDLAATQNGASIQVHRRLVVDAYSFPVTAYPSLRTFFQTAGSADEQQIVLRAAHAAQQ